MSAPRKITTARRIGSGRRDILTAETTMSMGYVDANTYHHDDVVRELERELQAALAYFDHHGITGGSVETTRAALAKIAQEGEA